MRVLSPLTRVDVSAEGTARIPLTVVNTTGVIDSFSARVVGLPEDTVTCTSDAVGLFPEASADLVLALDLPGSFPAGSHLVTVLVQSASGAPVAQHDLEVVVPEAAGLALRAAPSRVRARREATFDVEVLATGNVAVDVALRARDTERTLRCEPTPSTLSVPAGGTRTTRVRVRAPLAWTGSDQDLAVRLEATAGDLTDEIDLVLRRRPVLSRGLLTILTLALIITLWAVVLLLGIRGALGADPVTRVAPASYFAATAVDGAASGGDGTPGAAPEGALPKEGQVPAGVGGTLTGRVTSEISGEGVGRLTVEAVRRAPEGLVTIASSATQDDGTYAIGGLFPGEYLLKVGADGYETTWYATGDEPWTPVRATSRDATSDVDVTVVGDPATLHGRVDTGAIADGAAVDVTVTVRAAWSDDVPARTVEVGADGAWSVADLPAPGTYEITAAAEGYQPATTREKVAGGQSRFVADLRLGTTPGQVSGTVTAGGRPLGAVTVTTSVGGRDVTVGTPTLGQVGRFVLPGLPTPGTYLLTFTREGFGSASVVVDLAAGEVRGDVAVELVDGAGSVTGRVLGPDGKGVGGATVVVAGGATPLTVTTLTSGDVGAFTVSGLATPGAYTLAVTAAGLAAASVPVDLDATGLVTGLEVRLGAATGDVRGTVKDPGGTPLAGARVVLTDGLTEREAVTTDTGAYVFPGLAPGTYTVTATAADGRTATGLARVTAGGTARSNLRTS
ncbi:carboxypeptidase-like regulatory domain-containing protein [Sanguibacter sp. HDW7]|uniref:carboxypeptidase-like regulatory domain-containing protein n=1 Tax=Sanguibacter sp. HDW7 TaxID=2714931 RepID=UPI00140B2365|nr:carboxypeptidase-like regulatory domain-containing protein [Sanguibacter sp. HDW7]QIK83053.1 carboxypeptidase regulatory-like domain-containing protein [Sanguibacter sp. HDW7]